MRLSVLIFLFVSLLINNAFAASKQWPTTTFKVVCGKAAYSKIRHYTLTNKLYYDLTGEEIAERKLAEYLNDPEPTVDDVSCLTQKNLKLIEKILKDSAVILEKYFPAPSYIVFKNKKTGQKFYKIYVTSDKDLWARNKSPILGNKQAVTSLVVGEEYLKKKLATDLHITYSLIHELGHAVFYNTPFIQSLDNHSNRHVNWATEGTTDVLALTLTKQYFSENRLATEIIGDLLKVHASRLTGARPYFLPLHIDETKLGAYSDDYDLATKHAITKDKVAGYLNIWAYQTSGGFWSYLIDKYSKESPKYLLLNVFHQTPATPFQSGIHSNQLKWLDTVLKKYTSKHNVKSKGVSDIFPEFITEYAAWGGSRWQKSWNYSSLNQDPPKNGEDAWLKVGFDGCTTVHLSQKNKQTQQKLTLDFYPYSSQCIKLVFDHKMALSSTFATVISSNISKQKSTNFNNLSFGRVRTNGANNFDCYTAKSKQCILKHNFLPPSRPFWATEPSLAINNLTHSEIYTLTYAPDLSHLQNKQTFEIEFNLNETGGVVTTLPSNNLAAGHVLASINPHNNLRSKLAFATLKSSASAGFLSNTEAVLDNTVSGDNYYPGPFDEDTTSQVTQDALLSILAAHSVNSADLDIDTTVSGLSGLALFEYPNTIEAGALPENTFQLLFETPLAYGYTGEAQAMIGGYNKDQTHYFFPNNIDGKEQVIKVMIHQFDEQGLSFSAEGEYCQIDPSNIQDLLASAQANNQIDSSFCPNKQTLSVKTFLPYGRSYTLEYYLGTMTGELSDKPTYHRDPVNNNENTSNKGSNSTERSGNSDSNYVCSCHCDDFNRHQTLLREAGLKANTDEMIEALNNPEILHLAHCNDLCGNEYGQCALKSLGLE